MCSNGGRRVNRLESTCGMFAGRIGTSTAGRGSGAIGGSGFGLFEGFFF